MIVASPDRAPSAPTTLVALVAHARSVPSVRREVFGERLGHLPDDPRRILIRTCHRVELYATMGGADRPELADLPPGVERLEDVEAVRHLLGVACGLDSAVFGETQILHQLRETIETRRAEHALDPVLDRLFQAALRAGREARTYFTGSPRSLADIALDRIARPHPGDRPRDLVGAPILVVGTGRMARLAAFAAHRRAARVTVMNRTASRAAELAAEVGGHVSPFGADGGLEPMVGVVVAISGSWPLGERDLETLRAGGATVVDLSSPPALDDPLVARLEDQLISVDDLANADEDMPDVRIRRKVERLVSRAGADYCDWLRSRRSVPAIRGVAGAAEGRRADEMAWLRRRLPDLTPDDLAVVEQLSHRLVAAILHAPLSALSSDVDGDLEPAARELFAL
jgi:glutamyl-tRNA reductase